MDLVTLDDLSAAAMLESSARIEAAGKSKLVSETVIDEIKPIKNNFYLFCFQQMLGIK